MKTRGMLPLGRPMADLGDFDLSSLTREEREILIRKSEADEDWDVFTERLERAGPGRVVVPDTGERDYDTEGEGSAFDGRRASQEGGKAQEPP